MLDTTHPAAIRGRAIDLERTLFIVPSKSGTTLETRSTSTTSGRRPASGGRFVAITDPGSELERLANERGFASSRRADDRRTLLGALALRDGPGGADGIDVERLLARAERMASSAAGTEPGYELGPRVRRGLGGRTRQGLHRRDRRRLRPLGRAADRRVDRASRGRASSPRPASRPTGRTASGEPQIADPYALASRVLPLGVRGRGRRHVPRHQPVRPARRSGGEGQDERGARGR